jgi:hypothetical protein
MTSFIPLKESSSNLRRFIAINGLQENYIFQPDRCPSIEVFIPSVGKDLDLIRMVVLNVISTSINPINKITICVPLSEVGIFKDELRDIQVKNIKIVAEEEILDLDLLRKIKSIFGSRSGWVTAEFLKIEFATSSNSAGVLVVDSDTIILQNRIWLDQAGTQSLFPVQEYHSEYFEVLLNLGLNHPPKPISFMSHYMLFQPKIYRELYSVIAGCDPVVLLRNIVSATKRDSKSPFCICYEAYALYISTLFPNLIVKQKWANFGLQRYKFKTNPELNLAYFKKRKLESISLHAYL